MNSKGIFLTAAGCLGAMVVLGQAPAPQQGPGVQAAQDARYADAIAKCKVPPPQRGGGRGGEARGAAAAEGRGNGRGGDARGANAAAGPPQKVEYKVESIPGVIAAGQQWKS